MGLSNYQLVLLDNLIYLKSIAWGDAKTVGKRICDIVNISLHFFLKDV